MDLKERDFETRNELIELKREKEIIWCESQSGFDGRLLMENPKLAKLLKKARFRYPRIAWDGVYKSFEMIKRQSGLSEEEMWASSWLHANSE